MLALSPSLEDYLEAIFEIDKHKSAVHVKDVAAKLGVTMPSVNSALKNLEAKGLVKHEKYECIELTLAGTRQALSVYSRHQLLSTFLEKFLGVDAETAEEDACKIEHVISPTTAKKLMEYVQKETENTN